MGAALDGLLGLGLDYPAVSGEQRQKLLAARASLVGEAAAGEPDRKGGKPGKRKDKKKKKK